MTRTEAIKKLQSEGFVVRERNWSLGDSICVCAGESSVGDITTYSTMEYIFPEANGAWGLTGFMSNGPTRTMPSLEEAVAAITEVLKKAMQ